MGLAVPTKKTTQFGSKSATALVEDEPAQKPTDWRDRRRGTIFRDDSWKKIQQRTFTNWFNDRMRGNLKVARRQVKDLETDLEDGLLLIDLLEKIAAPNKVGRYSKRPTLKPHCIANLGTSLHFIATQHIKLVNIGK